MPPFLIRLAMLLLVFAGTPATVAQEEKAENPVYQNWARFKKGATVTYQSVTETATGKTEAMLTYTLIELTPESAVIEMVVATKADGTQVVNPPQRLENPRYFSLPAGVKKETFGKPQGVLEQGEETVKVAGKEYQTK